MVCEIEKIPSAEKIQIHPIEWNRLDLHQILEIENESFNSYDAYSKEDFDRWCHYNPDLCAVAEIEGRYAGYVLMRIFEGHGDLASLAVSPTFRQLGVGQALFEYVVHQINEYGIHQITLEVRKSNAAGCAFWEKMGFTPCGSLPGFYGDGEDAVQMEKKIG